MEKILNREEGKLLAERIAKEAGVNVRECYQCGKCSAGCPMADSFDLMPRQVIHCLQLGDMEEIFKSKSIWLCASCHTCSERCPHEIDVATLMEKCRIEAQAKGYCGQEDVKLFNDIFTFFFHYTTCNHHLMIKFIFTI